LLPISAARENNAQPAEFIIALAMSRNFARWILTPFGLSVVGKDCSVTMRAGRL
jgi:hypothetical protein